MIRCFTLRYIRPNIPSMIPSWLHSPFVKWKLWTWFVYYKKSITMPRVFLYSKVCGTEIKYLKYQKLRCHYLLAECYSMLHRCMWNKKLYPWNRNMRMQRLLPRNSTTTSLSSIIMKWYLFLSICINYEFFGVSLLESARTTKPKTLWAVSDRY